MSDAKHTPGPWLADGAKVYESQDFGEICSFWSSTFPVWEANARLIAAAPDMLEALERIVALCDACPGVADGAAEIARPAIAKVKGETP